MSLATLQSAIDNIKVEQMQLKMLMLVASKTIFCNGRLTWPINDVMKRFQNARLDRTIKYFSPPFYSKPDGYKMCLFVYLYGCGTGEGTHLSIYFALMRGEYDPLLQWPFEHKVNLTIVDQDKKDDITHTIGPTQHNRPKLNGMDSSSGFAKFAPLSILDDPRYVKDDVMYIRAAIIDTQS